MAPRLGMVCPCDTSETSGLRPRMNAIAAINRLIADPSLMPPELLEGLMEGYRRELRGSLLAWCKHCLDPAGHVPALHHRLIIRELEQVADGTNKRLMLFLPPGSAKSTYTSVLFPPWFLCQHNGLSLVAASHTVGLAEQFGRQARDMLAENGPMIGAQLAGDGTAAGSWRLSNGSRYYAVGAGGSLTGRRADIALLDDLVADQQEADSETQREKLWNWYNSVLYTRLKPGGRIILIMTRWHQDDIAGRLLQTEANKWRVLKLPALAEDGDALGREPGEPLWSDGNYGYGQELIQKRDDYVEKGALRTWTSLYQQNPTPGEGALFKVERIETLDAAPASGQIVRAWDLAATKQAGSRDPDWTAGVKLAKIGQRWCVTDVKRLRGGPDEVEAAIVATAQADGKNVKVGLPQDPGQAGKAQVAYLTSKLAGWNVDSGPESGAKETRAAPIAAQCNVGNLSVVHAPWNRAFIEELRDFPAGTKDDQVDALSRAFAMLSADNFDSSYGWVG